MGVLEHCLVTGVDPLRTLNLILSKCRRKVTSARLDGLRPRSRATRGVAAPPRAALGVSALRVTPGGAQSAGGSSHNRAI